MRNRHILFTILFIFLASLYSCQRDQELAGKYQAAVPSEKAPLVLFLKGDGKGSWTVAHENVPFSWESRKNEVWLHSKSGGVIVGRLGKDNSIEMNLPGVGSLHFEKVRE